VIETWRALNLTGVERKGAAFLLALAVAPGFQSIPHAYYHLVQFALVDPVLLVDGGPSDVPGGGPQWLIEGSAVYGHLRGPGCS
jgi:hypothetical protein